MKKYRGLLFFTAFLVISCSQTITPAMLPPAESLQPQSVVEAADFSQARQNFIDKCSGCHFHMYPGQFKPRQWKQTMREHVGNTNLSKVEYQKLVDYLIRASELSHGQ